MDRTLLSIDEFAGKLGIGRSTVYAWMAEGKLVVGRHVVRIGKVVRIVWCDALLDDLLELSVRREETPAAPTLVRTGRGGRNRLAFDAGAAEELLGSSAPPFAGMDSGVGVESKIGRNTPGEEVETERGIIDE